MRILSFAQELLKRIRLAGDAEKAELQKSLIDSQKQKLWKRFEYNRNKKAPAEAKQHWNTVQKLDHREGQREMKNQMLWAWVDDDYAWSSAMISEWAELMQTQEVGTDSRWVSYGRLCLGGQRRSTVHC